MKYFNKLSTDVQLLLLMLLGAFIVGNIMLSLYHIPRAQHRENSDNVIQFSQQD